MRAVAIILGLALAAVAVAYWVVPAGSLPGFFPGFEAGSDHVHMKHGLAAAGDHRRPPQDLGCPGGDLPGGAEQRWWNHKLVNVLDGLPKKKLP